MGGATLHLQCGSNQSPCWPCPRCCGAPAMLCRRQQHLKYDKTAVLRVGVMQSDSICDRGLGTSKLCSKVMREQVSAEAGKGSY